MHLPSSGACPCLRLSYLRLFLHREELEIGLRLLEHPLRKGAP